MGSSKIGCSSAYDGNATQEPTKVVLNIYDLTPVNNYTYWFGFGIFHSGIEVHGKEYGFGAHDYPVSGVFEVEPKNCPGFIYRSSIVLGRTTMPASDFRAFVESTAAEYHGDTYNLISKNCNHFTDDISKRLLNKHIPGWVNRLARIGSVCGCLLPESIQATTVKQLPEYHDVAEDGAGSPPLTPVESSENFDTEHLLSPTAGNEVSFVKEKDTVNVVTC